jgi:hypothetical protein
VGHKEIPVIHLRKMMLEELQRRIYTENTTRSYIRTVEDFARRFHRPSDCLGPQHIREYQSAARTYSLRPNDDVRPCNAFKNSAHVHLLTST